MRKFLVTLICTALLLTLCATAMAAPVLSSNGYTAYLGESNYLYLRDPAGVTRVLRRPIKDLVAMNDTELFCLTEAGQLYGIMLDASDTRIVSATPTEDDLNGVKTAPLFTLENGVLTLTRENSDPVELSQTAIAAAVNDTTLYYVETVDGTARLMSQLLDSSSALISALTQPYEMGSVSPNVVSITATEDAVAMVKDDHSITAVNLTDNSFHEFTANADTTTLAISIGNKLIRVHEDTLNGGYTVESTSDDGVTVTPTPEVTATPTVTPTATATTKPTATPKTTEKPSSSSSSSSSSEDDGRISNGAKGSSVKKMQKQLAALGYPVGKIDGTFGPNTLRAVHLFQAAIGYKERSYASASMLKKLYASSAPAYDRFAALTNGDKGEEVEILQEMLYYLGYLGKDAKEIDGKYGKKTVAAVQAFQTAWGLEPADGNATRETMEKLCALYDEFLATGKVPQPAPTEVPPVPPTEPEQPSTPTDPEQPTEPDPEQPTDPDPEQPTDPEPEQPTEPEPEQPSEPEPETPASPTDT